MCKKICFPGVKSILIREDSLLSVISIWRYCDLLWPCNHLIGNRFYKKLRHNSIALQNMCLQCNATQLVMHKCNYMCPSLLHLNSLVTKSGNLDLHQTISLKTLPPHLPPLSWVEWMNSSLARWRLFRWLERIYLYHYIMEHIFEQVLACQVLQREFTMIFRLTKINNPKVQSNHLIISSMKSIN